MESDNRGPSIGAHPSLNRIGGSSLERYVKHEANRTWKPLGLRLLAVGTSYDVGCPGPMHHGHGIKGDL
jgi:hypothetical protein